MCHYCEDCGAPDARLLCRWPAWLCTDCGLARKAAADGKPLVPVDAVKPADVVVHDEPVHEQQAEAVGFDCDDCGREGGRPRSRWSAILCDRCNGKRTKGQSKPRPSVNEINKRLDRDTKPFGDSPGGIFKPENRLRMLARTLVIAEVLGNSRSVSGVSLATLTEEVNERLGESYCHRTIRRDAQALELAGIVYKEDCQWYWHDTQRSRPLRSLAGAMAKLERAKEPDWGPDDVIELAPDSMPVLVAVAG